MQKPARSRVYQNHHLDSTYWDGVTPRPDDIVIATPSKAGTTWTQTIVAHLLFADNQFPAPIQTMSVWIDAGHRPREVKIKLAEEHLFPDELLRLSTDNRLLLTNKIDVFNTTKDKDDGGYGTCLNANTGEAIWRKRIGGEHCSSPICIGDRIYFFDREGKTVVIARSDKFEKLATNHLADGFMSSPAIVGDAFILRTKSHLYRIEKRP